MFFEITSILFQIIYILCKQKQKDDENVLFCSPPCSLAKSNFAITWERRAGGGVIVIWALLTVHSMFVFLPAICNEKSMILNFTYACVLSSTILITDLEYTLTEDVPAAHLKGKVKVSVC